MRQSLYALPLLLGILLSGASPLGAQEELPLDSLCVPFGQGLIANVLDDDFPVGQGFFVRPLERECFRVDERGNLVFGQGAVAERCCGRTEKFSLEVLQSSPDGGDPLFIGLQPVELTIKCPKVDCAIVDLADYPRAEPGSGDEPGQAPARCVPACENGTATYLWPEDPGLTYVWTAGNGTPFTDPAQPGQVTVNWGGATTGATLQLAVFDAGGTVLLGTFSWCVELTPAPVADFTATTVACLGQEVYFTNTSTGAAASYDWDFGDGQTAQGVTHPSHAYTAPGTYTVTLYATASGSNADGSAACCCTDTVSYDLTVDPLPGPAIYWISTLCEGDTSRYWTDAVGCGTYAWTVSPNGSILSGLGTDTITVAWASGPGGTVELDVTGCATAYCPVPSVAVVPIISANGLIDGPTEVCKGETATYELPKWLTVAYQWGASAGAIIGPDDGHLVNITWPTVPGTYVLEAAYGSDFLAGLPGHSGDDCSGTARLEVTVLGDFTLSAVPNPACVDNAVTVFGTSDINPSETFTWEVIGYPGLSTTGSSLTLNPGDVPGPGVYTVVATVSDPAAYCVDERLVNVVVKEAITPVITGPAAYCVGEPVVYSVASPAPGYVYTWVITPPTAGTVDLGQGSPTATITLSATSGVTLSVTGTEGSAPACTSLPASLAPVTKELVPTAIYGPAPCTNSLATYGITNQQHPDAIYSWTVDPPTAGSVVAGATDSVAAIQWNDAPGAATVQLVVELCGQTANLSENLTLSAPLEPVIVQDGDLCPSGSAYLRVDDSTNFTSFTWTLPTGPGPASAGFTVTTPGDYVVNTLDANGCPGVARYRVSEVPGPVATLSLTGLNAICVNNAAYPPFPANPLLTATTAAANTIEWFCNGVSQGPATTGNNTLNHVWNDTVKTYAYTVIVTDPSGCTESPDPLLVYQQLCCDTPFVTDPFPRNHDFVANRNDPECDVVDLVATFSGDSVLCHGFDLPPYSTVLSFGGTDDTDSLRLRLPGVGCFVIGHELGNRSYDYDTVTVTDPLTGMPVDSIYKADSIKCFTGLTRTVCNPLLADFEFSESCGTVAFTDASLIDPSLVNGPVGYSWSFGEGGATSSLPSPTHTYPANGTYSVTLTVADLDCQSTVVLDVVVTDLPDSDFTFAPAPVCAGVPVTFTGTGTNVIEWEWDFADGATFNGNGPQHTFTAPGGVITTYDVVLYTTNAAGCLDTVTRTVTVYPAPLADGIEASNGLIICAGSSTTLSVDAVAGYGYLWNTGATTNAIAVTTAGTYSVVITTADGCDLAIDPVEVQLVPLPPDSWKGNPYLCDNGSTTLMSLAGGGHDYAWTNLTSGATGPNAPSYTVGFLPGFPEQEILLQVTSQDYGCVAETLIVVGQATSPAPVLAVTGGLCAGDGSTIYVTNPEPDVVYSWNTGVGNDSMFTYQAGTYVVVATDSITGCTGTAQVTIHPLPDLCSVPTGCYETCAPDTLCAPAGNYSYAWFQNGMLVGSGRKLEVSTSGAYSVTVFDNATACFASSDSLYLEVLDCSETDCDGIVTELDEYVEADGNTGGCCSELFYGNLPAGIYAIEITSPDADLEIVPGSVDPLFGFANNANPFTIQLAVDAVLSAPLPALAPASSALAFCPVNFLTAPQVIVVNYLGADLEVVCSDTLRTTCPVEPECVYVTRDTLTCADSSGLLLTFEACVPADATFPVGHLQLLAASAAALADLPVDLPVVPAMAPGECRTFSVALGDLPEGAEFCYSLVAHTADPRTNPDALCCSDGAPRCLEVPDCDPCDDLRFALVQSGDDCCHEIVVADGEANYDFDALELCVASGPATIGVHNGLGDPLTGTVGPGGQTATYVAATGGPIPSGNALSLRFCLDGFTDPETTVVLKWISDGKVLCTDTLTVRCLPPCGYLEEKLVECDEDGYVWTGNIVNTSAFPAGAAHISFDPALGLGAFDATIVFGTPLGTNDVAPVSIAFGAPGVDVDSVCFTVTLHELNDDDLHLNCCQLTACVALPDCDFAEVCRCEDLAAAVQAGFGIVQTGANPFTHLFVATGTFQACDRLLWFVRSRNPSTGWVNVGAGDALAYTFAGAGAYEVGLYVQRVDDDGTSCTDRLVLPLKLRGKQARRPVPVRVFPNPATTTVNVQAPPAPPGAESDRLRLFTASGTRVRTFARAEARGGFGQPLQLDVRGLPAGVYLLRGAGPDGPWTARFVVE